MGALIVLAIILKICSRKNPSTEEERPIVVEITPEIVIESHENVEKKKELNAILFRNIKISPEDKRIMLNKQFWKLELKMHNGVHEDTIACMKNQLYPVIFKDVHEDNFPGFVRKYLPQVEKIKQCIEEEKCTLFRWIITKVKKICRVYVDIAKDAALTSSILVSKYEMGC